MKLQKKKNFFFDIVPLKGYIASLVIFRFLARNQEKHCRNFKRLKFDKTANI